MTANTRISSADDPRIADYTSVRERDLVGRDGKFIVEGKVTLEILLSRSRFAVESVFVAESRLDPLSNVLKRAPSDVPVYTASQSVMDEITGFPLHRGVLAIARKQGAIDLDPFLADLPKTSAATLVVAIGLSNHDNVGAVFRNAAAFGAAGVVLDATCCDPLYRKAIRVSAGTALWVPYVQAGDGAEILDSLQGHGFTCWTLTPDAASGTLQDQTTPERLALVLGPEGPGLPADLIKRGVPVRIPMADGVDSVNVATAAAIALAHVFAVRCQGAGMDIRSSTV